MGKPNIKKDDLETGLWFKMMLINIPDRTFCRHIKLVLKFTGRGTVISKTILTKKNEVEEINLSNLKAF